MSTPALRIDAVGQRCPVPVITLARRISEVAVGDVVEVSSDDPAAATDIPAWCRMRGQELVGAEESGGTTSYLIRRLH